MASKVETWEDRVDQALDNLTRAAAHTFRSSAEGQRIEAIGCILGGLSSWWIDERGNAPIIDRSPCLTEQCAEPFCRNDMTTMKCPNAKIYCLDHCGENHD